MIQSHTQIYIHWALKDNLFITLGYSFTISTYDLRYNTEQPGRKDSVYTNHEYFNNKNKNIYFYNKLGIEVYYKKWLFAVRDYQYFG